MTKPCIDFCGFRSNHKRMAEGGRTPNRRRAKAVAAEEAPLPLPIELPSAMFTGPGLLALADLLPVMTAYVDRDFVYRFVTRPLAEWLGKPRKAMLGRPMAEVLGAKNFAAREP